MVGNLWDVTDRDIDRLTEEFLEEWLNDDENQSQKQKTNSEQGDEKMEVEIVTTAPDRESFAAAICVHLNKARDVCKMAYLNGSAPIVYGLPVTFKKRSL